MGRSFCAMRMKNAIVSIEERQRGVGVPTARPSAGRRPYRIDIDRPKRRLITVIIVNRASNINIAIRTPSPPDGSIRRLHVPGEARGVHERRPAHPLEPGGG